MDYLDRSALLGTRLKGSDIDLLVLSPGSNLKYFTGFTDDPLERLILCLVSLHHEPIFVAPKLWRSQIQNESPFQDVRTWLDVDGPEEALAAGLRDIRWSSRRVAVDDGMPVSAFLILQKALPEVEFVPCGGLLSDSRLRKTSDEIRWMRSAARIADDALATVLDRGIVGMTELQVSAALKSEMLLLGADGISFEPIVGSGPNGAVGHHRPGERTIADGDAVILDFGCQKEGYCSDMTRTVICSTCTPEIENVYKIVRDAQEAGVRAVRPGVEAQEIDRIANELVLRSGMGEWHRTGHGIGLDVHEPPYIVKGNESRLEAGMAFSVEPGIYLPGRFGVRIEDVVVVTEKGATSMSTFSHLLMVVG